jgi:octopine/nopaline transport system permease protein
MDFTFLGESFLRLLGGVPDLFAMVSLSLAFGAVLSVAAALGRLYGPAPLRAFIAGYVFVFRGTPLLAQLFLLYYGVSQFAFVRESFLWPFLREPFWCAVLAFTLNTTAYGSEIVRGGLLSVPAGQVEAARACGMSGFLLYRRIIAPIALRQALPAYGNEIILMVKATSLGSLVTIMEVTGLAHKLISESFRAIEVFICAGAIYLAINFVVTRAVRWIEIRLSPHLRDAPETGPRLDFIKS